LSVDSTKLENNQMCLLKGERILSARCSDLGQWQ